MEAQSGSIDVKTPPTVVETELPKEEKTVVDVKVDQKTEKQKPKAAEVSKAKPVELQYKLNIYTAGGTIKQGISSEVYTDVSRRHGDVMRSVSPTRWVTIEEILQNIWLLEKRMKHPSNRTRKSVEDALTDLLECQFIITR